MKSNVVKDADDDETDRGRNVWILFKEAPSIIELNQVGTFLRLGL